MSKIIIQKPIAIIISILAMLLILGANGAFSPSEKAQAGEIDPRAALETRKSEIQAEKEDLEINLKINEIKDKEIDLEKQRLDLEKSLEGVEVSSVVAEPVAVVVAEVAKVEAPIVVGAPKSKYLSKWFKNRTGQTHWDICNSADTGKKFVKAFEEFGADAQVIACVTLNYENGIVGGVYRTDAVSPCWSTNTQQAVARKCTYASDNSHGVDAGLFMINTFFQAKRITKLGGADLACSFADSKNASDPCNVKKIAWLHNIDNQILIIKDIYREQGFQPWVAYNKHVKPFV